jgi:beta-lactamase superfamily II metal-dependent hydrolase
MERARELTFLKSYQDLVNIDILKAPHHGSNSSNSDEFLEAVNAEEVLVSAHPNNTYGHPNKEVMNKYKKRTMIIHRTDESGSVELRKFMGKWIKKTAVSD